MKQELKIRAGDMPPQDIYQLSPSDIKQLLLDVLQPQHTGRCSSNTHPLYKRTLSTLSHPLHLTNLPLKTPSLHLNAFTHRIIFLDLIILSVLSTFISYYLLLSQPNFPVGIIKVLSYLIYLNTHSLVDGFLQRNSYQHYVSVSETRFSSSTLPRPRSWLNRRQIDGSLNRTPLGFYDRVWQILERTANGIKVAGAHLPQVPGCFMGTLALSSNRSWRVCSPRFVLCLCSNPLCLT